MPARSQWRSEKTTRERKFADRIKWVQIDIDEKAEDVDHVVSPDERWCIALARQ